MNSLSSSLMFGVTQYRNQEGLGNKIIAQAGYALIALVATVETVAALVFSALSLAFLPLSLAAALLPGADPFSSEPLLHSLQWLDSSAFSIGWSVVDFVLNPFTHVLVADEKSARQIADSGELMHLPQGAVLHLPS